MTLSVLAKSTEIGWSLLESYDIDPVPFFREAGIDPKAMNDMHSRISHAASDKLWKSIANEVDDPCFTIRLGGLWHPSYMHVLGYAWLTSSTLRSALNRLARYIRIINKIAQVTLNETDGQLIVEWSNPVIPQNDYWRADAALVVMVAMCRANYGDGLDPELVTLKHDKPACAGKFF